MAKTLVNASTETGADNKKLSALDAAAKVLAETGQPMSCKELITIWAISVVGWRQVGIAQRWPASTRIWRFKSAGMAGRVIYVTRTSTPTAAAELIAKSIKAAETAISDARTQGFDSF